jgi:hypothetical protein
MIGFAVASSVHSSSGCRRTQVRLPGDCIVNNRISNKRYEDAQKRYRGRESPAMPATAAAPATARYANIDMLGPAIEKTRSPFDE